MTGLALPTAAVKASFLDAMAEFRAEGRGSADDESMVGREIRDFSPTWDTEDGFAAYVAALRAEADPDSPRPPDRVPCTTFWWCEGDAYLGRIAVRHYLNERLRRIGGHIGYDVRPTARRQGHATAMLAAVLPYAAGLGIEQAMVCCSADNTASRRVIESAGGVLQDDAGDADDVLRFWVPTPASAGDPSG
jgi:predicted acetyltransferase